jgi:hypothetical protein
MRRIIAPVMLMVLICGSGRCVSADRAPAQTSTTGDPKIITLDFENVAVDLVAGFFDQLTGKHHVIQGPPTDRLDLIVAERVSVEAAHRMFLSAVRKMGYEVSTDGDTIHIVSPRYPGPPRTPIMIPSENLLPKNDSLP